MSTVYVASVSGGKDSTAMCLHLLEQGIDFEAVTMDTGWEHPETYRYLDEVLPGIIGRPVLRLEPKYPELTEELEATAIRCEKMMGLPDLPDGTPRRSGMVRLMLKKVMFPSRLRRWCTRELKIRPIQRHIKSVHKSGRLPVNCVGIRAAESRARAKLPERELSEPMDCVVWRPLIRWTEQDVIDIHSRHNVKPNPLYLGGALRVGCWPCIFSRKAEIRHIAQTDPRRIDVIRVLEGELEAGLRRRAAAMGETLESRGHQPPRLFQGQGEGSPLGDMPPIDRVVEWSRTAHGGRQMAMWGDHEGIDGCMRWGLCES